MKNKMTIRIPQPIKPTDTIAIVAPSGTLQPELLHKATELIKAEGYNVEVMPHVYGFSTSVFSASDKQRATDLETAITRTNVRAIICARGGYGAVRTLQAMDKELLLSCNKWLVGFSDITAIHSTLNNAGIASIHGPMLKHIALHGMHSPDIELMFNIMKGNSYHTITTPQKCSRVGCCKGVLVGGNLSIIYSLRNTPSDINPKGKILFLEDLSEYNYHIDRMIQNLKYSGFLSQLNGLILGQFTGMKDGATPFGKDAIEIITDAVAEYNYPILTGFQAGHASEINMPLLMGANCKLDVTNEKGIIDIDHQQ